MSEVYGTRDNANSTVTFWHLVYIDGSGIKFNSSKAWDGSEVGYKGITVDPASDNAGTIKASDDGNISSSAPGWYLMIVKATVNGRNIDYTVTFNKPNVYLIGVAVGGWDEANPAGLCLQRQMVTSSLRLCQLFLAMTRAVSVFTVRCRAMTGGSLSSSLAVNLARPLPIVAMVVTRSVWALLLAQRSI